MNRADPIAGTEGDQPSRSRRGFLSSSFGWLISGIWFLCQLSLVVWTILAICYSNLPSASLRIVSAAAFAAFAVWALWFSRQRRMSVAFCRLA